MSFSLFVFIFLVIFTSCGSKNVFESYEEKNEIERAQYYLEKGQFPKAKTILENCVSKNDENEQCRALLASTLAALADVSIFKIVVELSEQKNQSGGEQNPLLQIVPEMTSTRNTLLTEALRQITLIPERKKNSQIRFQEGFLSAVFALMKLKFYISQPENIALLTLEEAQNILSLLTNSALALGEGDQGGAVASAVTKTKERIDNADGNDPAEKIASFAKSTKT